MVSTEDIDMNAVDNRKFMNMLKAVADENRLEMIRQMSARERNVGEMAEHLKISDATASHHLSKLHSAGLVNLRTAGKERLYRVDPKRLAELKAYVAEMESILSDATVEKEDTAWLDALVWDDADKKVLRDYIKNGRMNQFPTKQKKYLVILRWLVTKFEPGKHYSEKEV